MIEYTYFNKYLICLIGVICISIIINWVMNIGWKKITITQAPNWLKIEMIQGRDSEYKRDGCKYRIRWKVDTVQSYPDDMQGPPQYKKKYTPVIYRKSV